MTLTAEQFRAYRKSTNGKATVRRYEQSLGARLRRKKYAMSDKGKERDRLLKKTRRAGVRSVIEVSKSVPCLDCQGKFPLCCMDFHHLHGKRFAIGTGRHTVQQVREEISKCAVLCSNCHRIRHAKRN